MFQSCSNPSQSGSQGLRAAEAKKPAFDFEKARQRTAEAFKRMREGQRPTPTRRPQQDEEILRLLREGKLPPRALTQAERLAIALCHARPTVAITFDSADLDSKQSRSAFSKLMRRVTRFRRGKPLSYFAVPACSTGHDGWHVHCLVWDFVPIRALRHHAKELGFGDARIEPLLQLGDLDYFRKVAYHPRQNDEVFGITKGDRHKPRPKGARRYLTSAAKTLERANPKLLSALNMAKDKSVSDIELLRACPLFSNQGNAQGDRDQGSSSPSPQVSRHLSKQEDPKNQHRARAFLKRLVSRARQWLGGIQRNPTLLATGWFRARERVSLGRAGPSG